MYAIYTYIDPPNHPNWSANMAYMECVGLILGGHIYSVRYGNSESSNSTSKTFSDSRERPPLQGPVVYFATEHQEDASNSEASSSYGCSRLMCGSYLVFKCFSLDATKSRSFP